MRPRVPSGAEHIMSFFPSSSLSIIGSPSSLMPGLWAEGLDPMKQNSLKDISNSDLTTLHFTAQLTVTWSLGEKKIVWIKLMFGHFPFSFSFQGLRALNIL